MKKKFELYFTREFFKELKLLEKETQIRIIRELKTLEEHPFAGKRLAGRLKNQFLFEWETTESSTNQLRKR